IEAFHVTSGLPWVWTIIGATVASRLLLLPFQLKQMKNTAKMAPHTADIAKLREDMNQARLGGDQMAMQRAMLQQKVLYEKMGVSMSGMMLPTFIQIPVTLGMFFAVKGICELPVPQLTMSGLEWLPNLAAADPTYILPVVLTAAMNFQLTIGMRDMAASPAVPHMVNAFRVLSIVGMFWMFNLPSGVLVYLLTSLTSMTAQSLLLRIPVVRAKLGIPPINVKDIPKSVSLKESLMALKRWWTEEKSRANELAARKRRRL
ncbi:60Kd inner membrane protein-domain-containing protein, partial [Abortiporus biennis]